MEATLNSMSLSAVIIFSVVAVVNGYLDGNSIKRGYYIDNRGHNIRFLWRLAFISLSCYSIFYSFPKQVIDSNYVWKSIVFCSLMATSFWLVFETNVNKFIGKSMFYIGKTALIDKIARKLFFNNGVVYFIFKFILFIGSIFLFYSL